MTALEYDIWDSWICILRQWSLILDSRIHYLLPSVRGELCVSTKAWGNSHLDFHYCHSSYTMVNWLTYYCWYKASWRPLEKTPMIMASAPCWETRRKQTNHKRELWMLARLLEAKMDNLQGSDGMKIPSKARQIHPTCKPSAFHNLWDSQPQSPVTLPPQDGLGSYMQFRAAKSRWRKFLLLRYSIPWAMSTMNFNSVCRGMC